MNNKDILELVSSGIDGKKNPQNGGLDEIANELRRCCELYEEKLRNGEKHVISQLELRYGMPFREMS